MTDTSKARALHDLIAAVSNLCKEWADDIDDKSLIKMTEAIGQHGAFFVTQVETSCIMPSRVSVAINIPSPEDPEKPNLIPLFTIEDVLPTLQ